MRLVRKARREHRSPAKRTDLKQYRNAVVDYVSCVNAALRKWACRNVRSRTTPEKISI